MAPLGKTDCQDFQVKRGSQGHLELEGVLDVLDQTDQLEREEILDFLVWMVEKDRRDRLV